MNKSVVLAALLHSFLPLLVKSCAFVEVNYEVLTPETCFINWTLSEECQNFNHFEVFARHRKFLSCNEETNNSVVVFKTETMSVELKDLLPYSVYQVKIKGIDGNGRQLEHEIDFITPSGIPLVRPKKSDPSTYVTTQAIKFMWKQLDKDSCRVRNGKPGGYRIELWGEDLWAASNKPLMVQSLSEFVTEFYAQKLLPFTHYKLKIFSLNADNQYNRQLPLVLSAQTSPTLPEAPDEIHAWTHSNTSVYVKWYPKYPPTGKINLYTMRIGVKNTNSGDSAALVWNKRIEIQPDESQCRRGNTFHMLQVCYIVDNLEPGTHYIFQVQVSNENITTPSPFSKSAVATTASNPKEHDEETTTLPTERPLPEPSNSTNESVLKPLVQTETDRIQPVPYRENTVLIVISLAVATVLIFSCSLLVYKLKVRKLQMRYQTGNFNTNESYMSSVGYGQSQRSMSTTFDSSVFLCGTTSRSFSGHVFGPPNVSGMTTANYIHNVSNQIGEIQGRPLPEPPKADNDSGAYVQIENGNSPGTLVSRYRKSDGNNKGVDSTNASDEATDVYGYLKPTFHRQPSPETRASPQDSNSNPIAVQSYSSPDDIDLNTIFVRRGENSLEENYDHPRFLVVPAP